MVIFESLHKQLTDQEFYTFIKFLEFFIEQKQVTYDDSVSFEDLRLGGENLGGAFNRVQKVGDFIDMMVTINMDGNFDVEIKRAETQAEDKPKKQKDQILRIIKSIQAGRKLKITDVGVISYVWWDIYDRVRFDPFDHKVSPTTEKALKSEMDTYLGNFINGSLAVIKKSYYKFEAQKTVLIKLIEDDRKIALYGNNFIIKEKIDDDGVLERMPDFPIVHTVYALQKMGYLEVVNIWEDVKYKDEYIMSNSKATRHINVNIILNGTFIDEINESYKKTNPKNIFEGFDFKKGVLKFAGEEIELSKSSKATDAVLLMDTLLKGNSTDWKHNDEILTDWGFNDEDQKTAPKNKVYFAGLKINNIIALKTKIEDFIDLNTTKARINPKYMKVDE